MCLKRCFVCILADVDCLCVWTNWNEKIMRFLQWTIEGKYLVVFSHAFSHTHTAIFIATTPSFCIFILFLFFSTIYLGAVFHCLISLDIISTLAYVTKMVWTKLSAFCDMDYVFSVDADAKCRYKMFEKYIRSMFYILVLDMYFVESWL